MRRAFALFFVACASQPAPSEPVVTTLDVPKMPASVDTPPPPPPSPVATSVPDEEPPPAPQPASAPFDKGAAAGAIGKVHLANCYVPGGPAGAGHITITFIPQTGRVASAVVDGGPYPGTSTASCISLAYLAQVKVPPFTGSQVRVGKTFILP